MKTENEMMNNIPFIFQKNLGQVDKQVKFLLRKNNLDVFFTDKEVVLAFINMENNKKTETNLLKLSFDNCNRETNLSGDSPYNCKINYFKGKDKSKWITNIDIYERILGKEIYENIDLVYYGKGGKLEYDFIVKPKANLSDIKIKIEGSDNLELDEEGNLIIYLKDKNIKMLKPRCYQQISQKEIGIESKYILDQGTISFYVEEYDETKDLIIDPQLQYSTYIGGVGANNGYSVTTDKNGYVYVTGYTYSIDFPVTSNAQQQDYVGDGDIFIIKLDTNASGSESLLYGSYLGGSNFEVGYRIKVDNLQNIYVTGYTFSNNFPITSNAYQLNKVGMAESVFVVKLATTFSGGESLEYSTYLGGSNTNIAYDLAIGQNEIVYVVGYTLSSDFPVTMNAYKTTKTTVGADAFIFKLDTNISGTKGLLYSSYLGGLGKNDVAQGVALDKNQNVYITGYTSSSKEFPITSNAYQNTLAGQFDAFLIKMNLYISGTDSLLYGSYFGGSLSDRGSKIKVGKKGVAYITGYTNSNDFPTTSNAFQNSKIDTTEDVFLIKVDTRRSGQRSLLYSTYLGGNENDIGYDLDLDTSENVYITGLTNSTDFPVTTNAYQDVNNGDSDAFMVKINTNISGESGLLYGTYLGGSDQDIGRGITIDLNENIYIAGYTFSTNFPVTPNGFQLQNEGGYKVFLSKLNINCSDFQVEKTAYPSMACIGQPITYTIKITNLGPDLSSNLIVNDILQHGVFLKDYKCSAGSISYLKKEINWYIPRLEVGETVICMIVVVFNSYNKTTKDFIVNTVTLKYESEILNPYKSTDTAIVYIKK